MYAVFIHIHIYVIYTVRSVHTYIYNINTYIWDCIKIPCIFKCPKIMLSCFPSYRLLRLWALSNRNIVFPAFCGCESILGRKSTNAISFHFSFMFLSFGFHVVFMSFHAPFILHYFPFMFLSCSVHLAFMSFNFPSLCINVQVFKR